MNDMKYLAYLSREGHKVIEEVVFKVCYSNKRLNI